jgi:vacuolar-type H+-ATPase subunit F/Vma7
MKHIAVLGRTDSIDYFRVLGCETFHVGPGELTEERMREILGVRFKVLLVTEEVYEENRELLRRVTEGVLPVLSVIPDVHGAPWKEGRPASRGIAFREMRRAVVKAVGQDISNIEES